MGILGILGGLLALAAGVCWIIILIDAFKNEIWKGVVGLLCGLYLLYYAVAEYQAPNKWTIVGVAIGGWLVGVGLMFAGGLGAMLQAAGPVAH